MYTNIQGLINNFSQLEMMVKPEFITLSETHLSERIDENEIELANYSHYYITSNSSGTGGVVVYFKKHWNITKIKDCVKESDYWMVAYQAKYGEFSIPIIAVYRSPRSQEAEFCEAVKEFLDNLCEKNYEIVLAGDFSIDFRKDYYRVRQIIFFENAIKKTTEYFLKFLFLFESTILPVNNEK